MSTIYIAIARNTTDHDHADPAMYGVIDWTIEARSRDAAASQIRAQHPGVPFALIPAVHFTEIRA